MSSVKRGNPVRGRLNSWLLAAADDIMHREYGERKRRLLGDVPETLLELGPGAGANFRYYPRDTRVIALEPNPMMHERLRAQADRYGIELDLRRTAIEQAGIETASMGLVVSTLVLCTVEDQKTVVSEVRRILEPGGRFVFLEHVAAPPGSYLRTVQRMLRRPWAWLGEGCQLDRDTTATILEAGFREVEVECFDGPRWTPVRPHIAGIAIR